MKQLPLKSSSFIHLEKAFGEWLDLLGYSSSVVYSFPLFVREFFHYLECRGQTQIHQIDTPIIKAFYGQLSQRRNLRRGGGLSNSSLNHHLLALDKLFEYLRKNAKLTLPAIPIPKELPDTQPVTPLTTDQVKSLYEATKTYEAREPVLAKRDRAILAIYYDCGLRRTEGVKLNVADINFDNRTLYVRLAKGGKQRFVPFSKTTAAHLMDYLYEARPKLHLSTSPTPAFFLNVRGQRAGGLALIRRLKRIQSYSDDPGLKAMDLYLHLLRHSIATHLLYQGMALEKVARFLGHSSLESTQLYTHLMEKVYGRTHTDAQPFAALKYDPSRSVKLHEDEP